jgi:hypothetical protein
VLLALLLRPHVLRVAAPPRQPDSASVLGRCMQPGCARKYLIAANRGTVAQDVTRHGRVLGAAAPPSRRSMSHRRVLRSYASWTRRGPGGCKRSCSAGRAYSPPVRPLILIVLTAVAVAFLAHASFAATRPGAVVTTKNGTVHILKGARCNGGRLYFGAPVGQKGQSFGLILAPFRLGRTKVIDGFAGLRPADAELGLSGHAYVNPDGKSGRFNVRASIGVNVTGQRYTGTWRCA